MYTADIDPLTFDYHIMTDGAGKYRLIVRLATGALCGERETQKSYGLGIMTKTDPLSGYSRYHVW